MNRFVLQIWNDETSRCTFYTVLKEGSDLSEADKFFDRFGDEANPYVDSAYELLELITTSIGDKYGATDDFFNRLEDRAQALPPKPGRRIPEIGELGIHFPLRLFCYRICESIVVLFNGGIKDTAAALDSVDLRSKFNDAQMFSKIIERAIADEIIVVAKEQRILIDFQGNHEINL